MNTASFFMQNFGKHFIQPTGNDWVDVARVLSSSYRMVGKTSSSRMQSGWAIVRPGSATLQLDLEITGIRKSKMTRTEAFVEECATWDGVEPRIFMLFDKAPIPPQNIFVSVDKRHVRICTNAGSAIENWMANPPKVKGEKK